VGPALLVAQGGRMKYRGKQYVVLSISGKWKWSVETDGIPSQGAPNRPAGKRAEAEIDRALAPKKRLVPPAC
jgi:hypothetical protein